MHIRIELLRNGEVKIKKILPADMESPDEVSIKDYKFSSLHGIIYSTRGGDTEMGGRVGNASLTDFRLNFILLFFCL
jgi:hypothetical protein